MSVDCQNFSVRAHELIELIYVANDNILFGVLTQQQSLDDTQTVRHILSSTVGPRLILEGRFVEKSIAVFLGHCRRYHLLPDAMVPLARLSRRGGQNKQW